MFTTNVPSHAEPDSRLVAAKQSVQTARVPIYIFYISFFLLICAYFFSYFFRVSASVVLPKLAAEWGMSASLTGFISSLYFYSYALMQPLSGALSDRYGPLRVVACGISIAAVGALMFALAPSPFLLAVGRLLFGLGLAPMISGALVYQAHAFPRNRYAFFSGLTYTIGNFGAVVSVAPLGLAMDKWGRSLVFFALAGATFILATLLLALRKTDPVTFKTDTEKTANPLKGISLQLREAFAMIRRTPQLLLMIWVWGTSFGSIMSLQGLWAVSWFKTAYHIPESSARLWATLIGVGVMAGNFVGANISASAKSRRGAIQVSALSYGILWAFLWTAVLLKWTLFMVGGFGFLLGMAAGVCYTHLTAGVHDLAPRGRGGSLYGAINMLTFFGVIVFQSGTGFILSKFPAGTRLGEYTPAGYLITFGIVVLAILISFCAILKLAPFPAHNEEEE